MTRRLAWISAGLLVLALALPALAMMIAPAPIPDRVASSAIIVVGKITAIEEKTVQAAQFPGGPKAEYKIAVLEVQEQFKGPKGLTHIRIGFVPPPPPPPAPKPGQPVLIGPRNRAPQLNHTVGQEALFFLTKHAEGDFHIAPMYFSVIEKKAGTFEKDVAQVKRCAKLLEDPKASLQSKNAEDRLATAAMLLSGYRTPMLGKPNPKTEPIDAAESKLILQAIATGDWSKQVNFQEVSPQLVFNRLNLTPKDGWNPPPFKDYQKEFPPAAQKWLKDHVDTYRIQRLVP